MVSIVKLKRIKKTLEAILETIESKGEDNLTDEDIMSEYDINTKIYNILSKKDKKWLNKTFKVIINNFIDKPDIETFRNILTNEFGNREPYKYITDMICGKIKMNSVEKLNIDNIQQLCVAYHKLEKRIEQLEAQILEDDHK